MDMPFCPSSPVQPVLRAVDFFCGAGGMTHGLRSAGIDVLGGIDNEEQCRASYESNNAPARFLHRDITQLTFEELAGAFGLHVDDPRLVFVGCSPCQYWSKIQTSRAKSEKTAFLLKEFQRFVEHFLPGFIVLENVPGLKTNRRSYLPRFLEAIEAQGYHYAQGIVDAQFYGVPQHRRRYLLIAARHFSHVALPEPEGAPIPLSAVLGPAHGFPPIPAGHADKSDFMHTTAALTEKNLRRLRLTPHDGGTRMAWKDDPELQIDAYRGKDDYFCDVYGRMHWDRPAPTITTRFHSLSNGRFGHPEEDRAISLREGAVLQSFPRDYRFTASSMYGIARQIGNAVPPALARHIGQYLVRMVSHGNI
ncbi:DNA cytosine methyltransferase [Desulfovibrio sp.]|uniref:DNA cytosine methyltransferase n=1 Tax=Desulfovibrio sp. TaxID=885 RepID=UPI003AB6FF2D